MRIIFMGTPDFSVGTLEALVEAGHEAVSYTHLDITIGEYNFSLLLNLLARISVPCFFMITGALLLGRQESLHKHAKRIFRFLIVLLVWSVIYMIWNAVYMKDPYQIKDLLYKPVEQHLWYLYAMIPIYLVPVSYTHLIKEVEIVLMIIGRDCFPVCKITPRFMPNPSRTTAVCKIILDVQDVYKRQP